MLHLAQSKPQFPRTKRVPTTSTRNKSVTSNLIVASAHSRTLTNSRLRNRNTHITNNSAIRVALTMQCCNRPRHQKRDFPERITPSATHRGRSTATSIFSSRSRRIRCLMFPNRCPLCPYVRVFSEYSDIPNRTNLDFLERNTPLESRERKSTLTRNLVSCSSSVTQSGYLFDPIGIPRGCEKHGRSKNRMALAKTTHLPTRIIQGA